MEMTGNAAGRGSQEAQHFRSPPPKRRSSLVLLQRAILFRSESFGPSLGDDVTCNKDVKELEGNDVEVGRLLGQGEFNCVYEVQEVRRESLIVPPEDDEGDIQDQPRAQFVVKHLRQSMRSEDRSKFCMAAADLALEAKLLASIRHPNIVRLHGVTQGSAASAFFEDGGTSSGYFLLLDKLECTLEDRLLEWQEEGKMLEKRMGKLPSLQSLVRKKYGRQDRMYKFFVSRLRVAQQVAMGMEYLHGRNILYRDLKPENIGFNCSGQVKIFDFGLVTAVEGSKEQRKFTGACGTPRYMAPEVARCRQYGLPADVYSFAILLWEVCALEKPFRKYSLRDLQVEVHYGTKRPKLATRWPKDLRHLMQRCWSAEPSERLQFYEVSEVLRDGLEKN